MANIFTTTPSGWVSTDGPINLGTRFTVDTATQITAGRYFKGDAANNGLVITMALYGAATTPVATTTRTQLAGDAVGWVTVPFATPIDVVPGVTYTIVWRTTGTAYYVTDSYPLTATVGTPFRLPPNHALYSYSGNLAKPSGEGGYSYAIDVVSTGGVAPAPTGPAAVKALDTDQDNIPQSWFTARAAEGVKLFITAGTPWSVDGLTTLNEPRYAIRDQFRMALAAGMKIALYTRNPNHWAAGLEAAGPYLSQLQFFAADVEPDPGIPVTQAMLDGIASRGVRPIVYAGAGFWADVQGSNTTAFAGYPLWDTNAVDTFSYTRWQANQSNLIEPAPIPYGGWNQPNEVNLRVGVQQLFDYMLGGVKVDLNMFNESFLVDKGPFEPPTDVPAEDQRWFTDAEVAAAKLRGDNLVLNGDFELGQQSWGITTGMTAVTAAKRNGALGLRVQTSAGTTYMLNNNVVQTYNGEQFYAEYWVRRTTGAAATDVYAELGFVAQSNNGSAWNTPTIYGELTKGGGGFTPADIPTDRFVKVAAIITVQQVGAVGVAFAPWAYTNPRTYDIDDMFVARISDRDIPTPPAQGTNKLRAYKLSAVATPQRNLHVHSMSVTAVPKIFKRLRVYGVQLEARIVPYALRKDGKWAQISTFVRKAGRWR